MKPASPIERSTASVKRVIVVDRDPDVTEVLSNVLKSDEWDIVHAVDNQAVLELVEKAHFDLIITGAKSTGGEDVDLLRKIRDIQRQVRFIILTDQRTPADVVKAMREGAFSYFSKPFSAASLAEMVRIASSGFVWDDGIELVSATPEWISVIARCDQKTADRLVQFIDELSDLRDSEKEDVAIAFREMLLNAIEHGGKFDPRQYVEVAYVRTRKLVLCRIKDPGQGFSLAEIRHAAINNPAYDPIRHDFFREAQGLRPGGYGLLMARHLVDELVFSEKGNEVLLVKHIPASQLKS
jgi:DNA-binding NarL/FixJ family response regulator